MFLVLFKSRKRADMDAALYSADDERMVALAAEQPGFISYNSYVGDDGENLSLSIWESEADANAWGAHPEHAVVRSRGWAEYYESYTMYLMNEPKVRQFEKGAE